MRRLQYFIALMILIGVPSCSLGEDLASSQKSTIVTLPEPVVGTDSAPDLFEGFAAEESFSSTSVDGNVLQDPSSTVASSTASSSTESSTSTLGPTQKSTKVPQIASTSPARPTTTAKQNKPGTTAATTVGATAPFSMRVLAAELVITDQAPERSPIVVTFETTCEAGKTYQMSIKELQEGVAIFIDSPEKTCPSSNTLSYSKELSLLYNKDFSYSADLSVSDSDGVLVQRKPTAKIR